MTRTSTLLASVLLIALLLFGCNLGREGFGLFSEKNPSLRSLAARRGLLIGTCVKSPVTTALQKDTPYATTLAREFNLVTGENCMKLSALCKDGRGQYDFKDLDALVKFAKAHHMKVRGVPLVWHFGNPKWLYDRKWTRDELIAIMEDHIKTVVGRYRGQIFAWDVVNEHTGSQGIWAKGIGPEYVDMAFRCARKADPKALLFYNECLIEDGGERFEQAYQIVKGLKEQGTPIDGFGFQTHITNDTTITLTRLSDNFQKIRKLGLQVHITELDVAIKLPVTPEKLARQAEVYRMVVEAALDKSNCSAIQMWGFTDRHSWIPGTMKGFGAALVFDENFQPKPAYYAMREALRTR